jgi:acetyltransferase-like isoleucine patch superfamily enzyme
MRKDNRPYWLRRAMDSWRQACARHFLAPQFDEIGKGLFATHPASVEIAGKGIRAGENLHLLSAADNPIRLTTWPGPGEDAHIQLGHHVLISGGVRLLAARSIIIGDACMLAHAVVISDCDWHGLYDRVTATDVTAPVVLERNVWLGDGAFIGKGVQIGENSVVGARAVVMQDVPANVVVAGNPARIVKHLDPDAPRRDRSALFADPEAAARFMDETWKALHRGNSSMDWLLSLVWPGGHH